MIRTLSVSEHALRGGYDPAWFDVLAEVEEQHFWFRARNQIIAGVVRNALRQLGPAPRVLEVGCGNGNVLRVLEAVCPNGTVTGMDLYPECLDHARKRCRCNVIAGDIFNAPFPAESFELIGMFDVLEHLQEDQKALRALHHLLRPGGAVLLTVPALPGLWSSFDEVAGHFRRYTKSNLTGKLADAGFDVVYASHFMTSILPLVYLSRRLARFRGNRSAARTANPQSQALAELKVRPILNALLFQLLQWERIWIHRGKSLPIGASLLMLARKRSA